MKDLTAYTLLISCGLMTAFLTGCAEIKPPRPGQIMREPLGESPMHVGMTKEKVLSIWGEADMVNVIGNNEQGVVREEWIYRGRYPNLPINIDYLKETQRLFFDGNHLVEFQHEK